MEPGNEAREWSLGMRLGKGLFPQHISEKSVMAARGE